MQIILIFLVLALNSTICVATSAPAFAPKPVTDPKLDRAFEANTDEVLLVQNEKMQLPVATSANIQIKGKNVIEAIDHGNHLLIHARNTGTATITMQQKTLKVHVVSAERKKLYSQLLEKLTAFLDLKLQIQNGEIVVIGQMHRLSDWQDMTQIAEDNSSHYVLKAQLDVDVLDEATAWLKVRAKERGLTLPHIVWQNGPTAYLPEDTKNWNSHWETLLKPAGITIVYEKSQLAILPLVRVNIVVAELNKKVQSEVGIEWPNIITAQISPKLSGPTSLEVFLKAMEEKGLGQVLASPNLLARSGSEADFLAGGEFGIKLVSSRAREVLWKKHGIYLKIKPQADLTGRLSIELSTEVSLVDSSQTIDGIPGLKTNRMSTHFDLLESRTIVLSGLIRNDWGKSHSGLAGLASLPIIGALFRSENFFNNRSELVIFVTPEIVNLEREKQSNLMPKDWAKYE